MANISLTNICNNNCSYCFGMNPGTNGTRDDAFMAESMFDQSLDYIEKSGIRQARLLGGEPTLHPDFQKLIHKILDRELHIVLFTNGLIAKPVLRLLEQLTPVQITVILNLSSGYHFGNGTDDPLTGTLKSLGDKIIPGVNIYDRGQDLFFMLDLIRKFRLQKWVRLGLAHPVVGGANRYLHPKFYPEVGEKIYHFMAEAHKNGIEVDFDCGFVPCMFPGEISEFLGDRFPDISRRCNPLPDILPDGSVISCYPLASMGRLPLQTFADINRHRMQFVKLLRPFRTFGIYPRCSSCGLFIRKECLGGCLAASKIRLR